MSNDPLSLARDASAVLERYGFVACGRSVNGRTSVDFWTRDGIAYQHYLTDDDVSVDAIVAACLALVPTPTPAPKQDRTSDLS